jgi:hypothetical protein
LSKFSKNTSNSQKRFGVCDALFPPELPIASQEELLDGIAVGRRLVSEERQALVLPGQLRAEP